MKTGTYDLSDEEYFAEDALNNSYLINKTPAHAQIGIDKTDAMTLGSAVHLAVLQPEISSNLIVQGPDNRRGKAWTEAKKDAEEDMQYPHGLKLWIILGALCLAVFLVALDQTIISTAIPKITDRLKSIQDIGW